MTVSEVETRAGDVFRQGGLAISARRIWLFLRDHDGMEAIEIRDRIGVSKSTVHRRLNDLKRVGLARSSGHPMKWFFVDRDLNEVATELGIDGAESRQRLRHQKDREGYYYARKVNEERSRTQNE